jgi:signal transduction histidine kinase
MEKLHLDEQATARKQRRLRSGAGPASLPRAFPPETPSPRPLGREAAQLAHDARNLLSALSLYCELLASPGVLTPGFRHYAEDLRVVGETGARLVEALAGPGVGRGPGSRLALRRPFPGIEDLGAEVLALEDTLRALAGPAVRLEIECAPCAGQLALNAEELLRILFNLVANAVEAMGLLTAAPRRQAFLRITAQRGGGASFLPDGASEADTVMLSVRDNGPGIAARHLERIFDPGFSTRPGGDDAPHGLGLAIVRELTEGAGVAVRAVSSSGSGAGRAELAAQGERSASAGIERITNFGAHKRERGIRC